MRLRVKDLKEIFLAPRLKVESECIESDEESSYTYGSPISLLANVRVLKNRIVNEVTGEKEEGSVEILYQGSQLIRKGDRVFININEHERVTYVVDDVIRHSSHLWAMLKVDDV